MSYIAGKLLNWERFWAPADTESVRIEDGDGFLPDPTVQSWYSPAKHLKSTASLLDYRCLILLGDPGMGKTTSLEALVAARKVGHDGRGFVEVHCRDVPDMPTFEARTRASDLWKQLRQESSTITLVIDGVDEGLRKVPEFIGALAAVLRDEPMENFQLVLACRTAEWDSEEGKRLMNLWPDEPGSRAVFEMKRLRWKDAAMAAETFLGFDSEAFMAAVHKSEAQMLAARPLTLRLLLEEFRAQKRLPNNRHELYFKAVRRSVVEWDSGRQKRLRLRGKIRDVSLETALAIARRIAGLMHVCGRSAITNAPAAQVNDLTVNELLEGTPASGDGEPTPDFTAEDVDAVVHSALFAAQGTMRFRFEHATFAEFLAAEFLSELDPAQIRRLLCVEFRGRERVIPQFAETAAWLATMKADWATDLLKIEPEVLLRSDLVFLPAGFKRRLVETLLQRAARLEILYHYEISRRLGGLKHPGITKQLRPWIKDASNQGHAHPLAIDMAGMTECRAVEPLLWEIATSSSPQPDRREAMRALHHLAGRHSKRQMQTILEGATPVGRDLEMLALIFKSGVPSVWPVRAVLPFLIMPEEPPSRADYHSVLAYHLPRAMTRKDIIPVLEKAKDWPSCFDNLNCFARLAYHALTMALDALDSAPVREALVTLWTHQAENHYTLPRTEFGPVKFLVSKEEDVLSERDNRYALATVLIEAPGFQMVHIWPSNSEILDTDDLPWVLKRTQTASRNLLAPWAAVAETLIRRAAARELEHPESRALTAHDDQINAVLSARGADVLMNGVPLLPKFGVTNEWVRREKAQRLKWKRRRRADHTGWKAPLEGVPLVVSCVEEFRSHQNCRLWVRIGQCVYFRRNWSWEALSVGDLQAAEKCAREFLIACSEKRDDPRTFTNYSLAGYAAIQLLWPSADGDKPLIRAIKQKWCYALHDVLERNKERHQDAIAWAYRIAPKEMIAALLRKLRAYDTPDGFAHDIRNFENCWDQQLSRQVLKYLQHAQSGSLVASCLDQMRTLDSQCIDRWIVSALRGVNVIGNPGDRISGIVRAALDGLRGSPWDHAWCILTNSGGPFVAHYLHHLASARHDREEILHSRTEPQLANLFRGLARLGRNPVVGEAEAHSERSVSDISILRSRVLGRLAEYGTAAALEGLERLQSELPGEAVLLAYYIKDCTQKRLSMLASQRAISPAELLRLRHLAVARWIESERDLFEVVQASIKRFQAELAGGSNQISVEDLWNKEAPKREEWFSKKLAGWLRADLRGIIVNRETQVESRGNGRLDIKIQSVPRKSRALSICTVIIEVKLCSHAKVNSAMQSQLIEGYMKRERIRHGIHLVAWFDYHSVRCARWSSLGEAQSAVSGWAAQATVPDGICVAGIVVDCRRTTAAPSKLK